MRRRLETNGLHCIGVHQTAALTRPVHMYSDEAALVRSSAHTYTSGVMYVQTIVSEFNIKYDDWMYGPFVKLSPELLEESITEWLKKMNKLAKSLPREDLKGVAETLRAKLDEFRGYLGLISCICNPGMRTRHWQAISDLAGVKVGPSEDESLHTLVQNGLLAFEKELQDLSDAASREHALEKQLDKMQAEWVRTFRIDCSSS